MGLMALLPSVLGNSVTTAVELKTDIEKIVEYLSEIDIVSQGLDDNTIQTVNSFETEIRNLSLVSPQIETVATIHNAVNVLGQNSTKLIAVADNLNSLTGIHTSLVQLLLLHGSLSNLLNLETNLTDVLNLESNLTIVQQVKDKLPEIDSLVDNLSAVTGIGGKLTELTAVHADLSTLSAVAADILNVRAVGQNITAVTNAASAVATLAQHLNDIQTIETLVTNAKVNAAGSASTATQKAAEALGYRNTTEQHKLTTKTYLDSTEDFKTETEGYKNEVAADLLIVSDALASVNSQVSVAQSAESTSTANALSTSNDRVQTGLDKTDAASSAANALFNAQATQAIKNSIDVPLDEINANLAETQIQVDSATVSAQTASTQAAAANVSANSANTARVGVEQARDTAVAVVSGGTATLTAEAGKIPIADSDGTINADWLPAEITGRNVFVEEQAEGNSKYAASGFVHFGKHNNNGNEVGINQGLNTVLSVPNELFMGREYAGARGTSKHDLAHVNIAGIETELRMLNESVGTTQRSRIKFPDAPNGTVTYDSATGTIVDYTKDVDPKYGDVAADTNEAVARAFEGVVKNGDFRLGDAYWANSDSAWVFSGGSTSVTEVGGGEDTRIIVPSLVNGVTYTISMVSDIQSGSLNILPFIANWELVAGSIYTGTVSGEHTITAKYIGETGRGQTMGFRSSNATTATVYSFLIRKVTTQVVTERVDMYGFEGFLEEVTVANPYVYPNGLIQAKANTMSGISTSSSNRPATYYAVFDGDTSSVGKGVDFINASNSNKVKMFSNPKNNLYWIEGKLYQWRVRQRTIAGAGNGDWGYLDSNADGGGTEFLSPVKYKNIMQVQGKSNTPSYNRSLDGNSTNTYRSTNNISNLRPEKGVYTTRYGGGGVDGHCYFLVCGTVPRLNQGAYHPSFNPMGTKKFARNGSISSWEGSATSLNDVTKLSCFRIYTNNIFGAWPISGYIGAAQGFGRPDGKLHDAIYASGQGGVIDYRMSAWDKSSPAEAAKVDAMVKNGTYRGVEGLVFTVISSNNNLANAGGTSQHIGLDNSVAKYLGKKPVKVLIVDPSGDTTQHSANPSTGGTINKTDSGLYRLRLNGNLGHDSDVAYILVFDTNISVSGEFTQTDVIGDPANILANPDLKDGWMGSWGGMEVSNSPVTRKSVNNSVKSLIYTSDDGNTYGSSLRSIASISNTISGWGTNYDYTTIISYTAFAKQTKVADNEPVVNGDAGLGKVMSTQNSSITSGVLLGESLINKICTGASGTQVSTQALKSYSLSASGQFGTASWAHPIHHPLTLTGNFGSNNVSYKALDYQVEDNQQVSINYAYEELIYDGGWGDNGRLSIINGQTTNTDDNGNTVLIGTATLALPYGWVKNNT